MNTKNQLLKNYLKFIILEQAQSKTKSLIKRIADSIILSKKFNRESLEVSKIEHDLSIEFQGISPQYLQWLVSYINSDNFKKEAISYEELIRTIPSFIRNKKKLKNKNINDYKSIGDIKAAIEEIHANNSNDNLGKAEFEKIYEDEKYLIVFPHNKEAACKYGKGTKWCIAASDSNDNYFNSYTIASDVFIYYIINKKSDSRKDKFAKVAVGIDYYTAKIDPYGDLITDANDDEIDDLDLFVEYYGELFDFFRKKIENHFNKITKNGKRHPNKINNELEFESLSTEDIKKYFTINVSNDFSQKEIFEHNIKQIFYSNNFLEKFDQLYKFIIFEKNVNKIIVIQFIIFLLRNTDLMQKLSNDEFYELFFNKYPEVKKYAWIYTNDLKNLSKVGEIILSNNNLIEKISKQYFPDGKYSHMSMNELKILKSFFSSYYENDNGKVDIFIDNLKNNQFLDKLMKIADKNLLFDLISVRPYDATLLYMNKFYKENDVDIMFNLLDYIDDAGFEELNNIDKEYIINGIIDSDNSNAKIDFIKNIVMTDFYVKFLRRMLVDDDENVGEEAKRKLEYFL